MVTRQLQHPNWRWTRWIGPLAVPVTVAAMWLSTEMHDPVGVGRALITAAAAVTLWGLYFVAARRNYLHIQATIRRGECLACGYNLRGTVGAGRDTCPECGEPADPSVKRYLSQLETVRRHAATSDNAEPPGSGGR